MIRLHRSTYHYSAPTDAFLMHFPPVAHRRCSDGTGNNDNKVPDVSSVDVYGNALACTCADGFITEAAACSTGALQSGACSGAHQSIAAVKCSSGPCF